MGPCCWKVGQTAVAQARPALESENLGSWAALSSVSMAIAVPSMPTVPVWGWPSRGWLRSEGCLSLCCCYSIANSCLTPCNPMDCSSHASLSFIISRSLLKLMSIVSMMPSNHLILCHPLLLLPSVFPGIRVFSNLSVLRIRWPKYWSFSFSISPSNECSGLISFRMDWFDLLGVQGTLKSLLQHHSSKALILWHSAFFMVQLTFIHDHWKNHSLDQMDLCLQSNVSAF